MRIVLRTRAQSSIARDETRGASRVCCGQSWRGRGGRGVLFEENLRRGDAGGGEQRVAQTLVGQAREVRVGREGRRLRVPELRLVVRYRCALHRRLHPQHTAPVSSTRSCTLRTTPSPKVVACASCSTVTAGGLRWAVHCWCSALRERVVTDLHALDEQLGLSACVRRARLHK